MEHEHNETKAELVNLPSCIRKWSLVEMQLSQMNRRETAYQWSGSISFACHAYQINYSLEHRNSII